MRLQKKISNCWGCIFFDSAQTYTVPGQNALRYDGNASGQTIYAYVMNNPLMYTDPSGYLSLFGHKILPGLFNNNNAKIAVVVAAMWFAPGIATSVFQSSYMALAAGGTAAQAATAYTAASVIGGAAAGAFVGATVGAVTGGTLQSTLQGAGYGAISGGIFGGIDSYYGGNWSMQRVAANSVGGGVSSSLTGGSFGDGAKMNFITSSARMGWEYARADTDADSLRGGGLHKYNKSGEYLSDGTRLSVFAPGYSQADNNWFTSRGMAAEGSGAHLYGENSWLGRAVNAVSKVHDFMNSWGYEGGNYVSRSEVYNTSFQAFSMAGMLPAAAYTAVAYTAGSATTYIEESRRVGR